MININLSMMRMLRFALGLLFAGSVLQTSLAQPAQDACSGEALSITQETIVTTPNYPNHYSNDSLCQWWIEAPFGSQAVLTVNDLDIEFETNCWFDSLEIRDGSLESGSQLDLLCGGINDPKVYQSSGSVIFVQFRSDSSGTGRGFNASVHFSELPPDSCLGNSITESGQIITSPDYPDEYPNMASCSWKITAPDGQAVELTMDDIEIEYEAKCQHDKIEIFDGPSSGSPLLATLCGDKDQITSNAFESSGSDMLVSFRSDSTVPGKGFRLKASFIGNSETPTCGVPAIQPQTSRIVGGTDVFPNSWPWQVSLQVPETRMHFCGGSIINNDWVITAAHCVNNPLVSDPEDFVVVVGEHNRNITTCTEEVIPVEDYYVHLNFSSWDLDNDMALVKLARPIVFRDEVSPVCLAEVPVPDGTRCTVTGWGQQTAELDEHNNTISTWVSATILQETELMTLNQETCIEMNGPRITENMLCASLIEGGGGACYGDSGGPLVCRHADTWFLHGVVSWGWRCASYQDPPVFLRVTNFISIINEILEGGAIPSRECGSVTDPLVLTELTGEIASPVYNFGGNYFDSDECAWRIEVPFDQVINLNFVDMDIEPGESCEFDSLTVFDGSGMTNDTEVGKFCGSTPPADITSQGNTMLIIFRSDMGTNGRGFKVTYDTSASNQTSETGFCGTPAIPSSFTRIVGGQTAIRGSWPWQVQIRKDDGHWCGGSLVDEHWAISAAHCFYGCQPPCSEFVVVVGEHDQTITEDSQRTITISELILHEDYDHEATQNDIALLRLAEDVSYNDYVSPVCVASTVIPDDLSCVTTGWGDTQGTGNEEILQQVIVPSIANEICNRDHYPGDITDQMLCAGYPEGGKDACQGDSGGPLVCQLHGNWFLHGITSFGFGCALPNKPGVYARVSALSDWISTNSGGEIDIVA